MDSTKIVGEKIKSLRETKEISVAELAVRSGLAEEQIERIENNVDLPSLAPLIKIARVLGVRLGTFLYVMEGTIEVCHGKKCHLIKAGDSIYYDSIVPHHVHGYQGQAAKILAVIYTPI